jgi:hypothetical protein
MDGRGVDGLGGKRYITHTQVEQESWRVDVFVTSPIRSSGGERYRARRPKGERSYLNPSPFGRVAPPLTLDLFITLSLSVSGLVSAFPLPLLLYGRGIGMRK